MRWRIVSNLLSVFSETEIGGSPSTGIEAISRSPLVAALKMRVIASPASSSTLDIFIPSEGNSGVGSVADNLNAVEAQSLHHRVLHQMAGVLVPLQTYDGVLRQYGVLGQ